MSDPTLLRRLRIGAAGLLPAASAAAILASTSGVAASPTLDLNNGPGDGSEHVAVDCTGRLGADFFSESYDPVGESPPVETVFESYLVIRTSAGAFRGINTGCSEGITGTATSASSSFTDATNSLSFDLTQVLTPVWNGTTRLGSLLTQTYSIHNPTGSAIAFDIARYFDADIQYQVHLNDGGGRMFVNGLELLFETDAATGTATSPVGVAITGEGGTIPATGRYQVDEFDDVGNSLFVSGALTDSVYRDGADADQTVDAGMDYDVELGLRNQFALGPGESTTYVTRTYFVSGDLPEPGSLSALCFGVAWLLVLRALRNDDS
jgi:hypothetical protein